MMKKIISSFGLVILIALAAMCSTPGSNQKQTQTQTQTQGNVISNQIAEIPSLSYWWVKIPVTKGTRINITYETYDNKEIDLYIIDNEQHNSLYVFGNNDPKHPIEYKKFYSGAKSNFQYTFSQDGLYFLIFNNTLTAPRKVEYAVTLLSGSLLEEYDYVICEGENVTIRKPEVSAQNYYEYYQYCLTYLQEGEVVNIYFKVHQNEYRNLFVKLYILDDKGYNSWAKSPYDYEGKVYFDKVNERDRSYEQVSWKVTKTGYYYFIFWNQGSPNDLKFDYRVYKD